MTRTIAGGPMGGPAKDSGGSILPARSGQLPPYPGREQLPAGPSDAPAGSDPRPAPLKPCAAPGCRALVAIGEARCKAHQAQGRELKRERDRRADARRREASPWRAWYATARWKAMREAQLRAEPLCAECLRNGFYTLATVAHHADRHEGDPVKFWDADGLESSCDPCHNREHQAEESAAKRVKDLGALYYPRGLRPSIPELVIVSGPPAAGKSTWVGRQAEAGDVVIDLDQICERLFGRLERGVWSGPMLEACLLDRNRMLRSLAAERLAKRAWFIVSAPVGEARRIWAEDLGAARSVLLLPARGICWRRVQADAARREASETQMAAIGRWFERYSPWPGDDVLRDLEGGRVESPKGPASPTGVWARIFVAGGNSGGVS